MTTIVAIDAYFPLGEVDGRFPLKENGRSFVLSRDFAYVDAIDGEPVNITIPAGFRTDFNSTPRMVWAWFPPQEAPEAGVVHDAMYRDPRGRSRQQVDRIHRRIMELKGERKSKRVAAWLGIRMGGWVPWGKYRAAEQVKGYAGPKDAA